MPHYDTSKTHPAYSPPPRRLGTGIWLGAVVVIAAVILGVFLWTGLGSGTGTPSAQPPPPDQRRAPRLRADKHSASFGKHNEQEERPPRARAPLCECRYDTALLSGNAGHRHQSSAPDVGVSLTAFGQATKIASPHNDLTKYGRPRIGAALRLFYARRRRWPIDRPSEYAFMRIVASVRFISFETLKPAPSRGKTFSRREDRRHSNACMRESRFLAAAFLAIR